MLNWDDPHTARWLRDAARYTGYNLRLSQMILRFSPDGGTLCSLGCGAGLTELELAPHFLRVTCVDRSAAAIAFLRAEAARRGAANLDCRVCDDHTLTGSWDTVLAILHGNGGSLAGEYLALARRWLIAVTHAPPAPGTPPEKIRLHGDNNADTVAAALDGRGLDYTRRDCTLSHGQPFHSLDDARRFAEAYARPRPGQSPDAYLAEQLTETGRADFPYYLPKEKRFSIFVVEKYGK